MIRLLTGGARAGKSSLALARAEALAPPDAPIAFVATAQPIDDEMATRIARHRAERGPRWRTVEEPLALPERLPGLATEHPVVVVDCLTVWVANLLFSRGGADGADEDWLDGRTADLARALAGCAGDVLLVTNEVGLGIVPADALSRRYRDALGRCNQRVAAIAGQVTLVVSGLPLELRP